jgi:hypothetical protein
MSDVFTVICSVNSSGSDILKCFSLNVKLFQNGAEIVLNSKMNYL